jgi:RHS repeat-associated protein
MTCTAPSGTTYSCTPLGLGFNQSNNQITTSGYKYDAAGNLLSDNTHGYVYDAENRIACVGVDINGNCTTNSTYYFYDPQGQRVGKQQYDTLEDYVYDPQGHITSVYANGSASPFRAELYTPQGRHVATWNPSTNYRPLFFNNADWLGTERARTDSGGTVRQSCADTPYGMNLTCTPPDLSPMHFTGKQRDYESNLDYFGARYFGGGSSLGRFMSPDEVFADQHPSSPQSWNLYSYTRNNPLTFVDDDGLRVIEAALKYTYYDVHGATAAEARANALAISGIKEEGEPMMGKTSGPMKVIDIRTQWSVQGYEGTYVTAQETLTSADVDLEQTITLPTWANESQASPEEKAAWDNAMTQLDDHEKGHAAINRDQSHKLDASLPGTSGSGGAPKSTDAFKEANAKLSQKLNQKVSANAAETNTRQVNYDKNTGHGTKKPDQ